MKLLILLFTLTFLASSAQSQHPPDTAAHRTAMEKLKFLVGKWRGEAVVTSADGKLITLVQTEDVSYRLDGLILQIEGVGTNSSGQVVFNAFAIVSYDQSTGGYRIRAWNAGRFVETELNVDDNGFRWGFQHGSLSVTNRMTVDSMGRWSETSEAVHTGRKVHSVRMLLPRLAGREK
ncbi:MAG: hypothetical protein AB7J34_21935 [Limisphaerales bacterium]